MESGALFDYEVVMKRYGMVIKVKPDKLQEYKELHAAVWPDSREST